VRNFDGETQIRHHRLAFAPDPHRTTETVFQLSVHDTNLFQLAVTEDGFSNHYDRVYYGLGVFSGRQGIPESYDDSGGWLYIPRSPAIVLDIIGADISDCDTYDSNVDGGGMFYDMSEESDDLTPDFGIDGDPCSSDKPPATVLRDQYSADKRHHDNYLGIVPNISLHRAHGGRTQHQNFL